MGRERSRAKGGMKKCPICGREFWCYDLDAWAYRVRKKGKGPQICSWSCQVEYYRALEEEKKRKARKNPAAHPSLGNGSTQTFCWLGNLTEIMDAREVTHREVVDAVRVSSASLSGYRLCDTRCRREVAVKIAEFLQVDTGEIITEGPVYRERKRRRGKKTPDA